MHPQPIALDLDQGVAPKRRQGAIPLQVAPQRLAEWLGREADVTVTVTPSEGEAWVRLRARGATPVEAAVWMIQL